MTANGNNAGKKGFTPPNRPAEVEENEKTPTGEYNRPPDPAEALLGALQKAKKKDEAAKSTSAAPMAEAVEDDETLVWLRSRKAWAILGMLAALGAGAWALIKQFSNKNPLSTHSTSHEPQDAQDAEDEMQRGFPFGMGAGGDDDAGGDGGNSPKSRPGGDRAMHPSELPQPRRVTPRAVPAPVPAPRDRGAVFKERERNRELEDRNDHRDERDLPARIEAEPAFEPPSERAFPQGEGGFFFEENFGDDWQEPDAPPPGGSPQGEYPQQDYYGEYPEDRPSDQGGGAPPPPPPPYPEEDEF